MTAPTILLLDEPTNHLDIPALEWLEQFLQSYYGSVLLISHDRVFLDRVVSCVYELDEVTQSIRKFPGDYSNYARVIEEEKAKAYERWKDQQAEIKRLKADWIQTAEQARWSENQTRDSKMRRYAKKVAKKGTAKKKNAWNAIWKTKRASKSRWINGVCGSILASRNTIARWLCKRRA